MKFCGTGWVLLIVLLFAGVQGHGKILREDIGELKIEDLLLRPEFKIRDPSEGAFSMGESSFALRWTLEQKFGGVIRIGPRTLLNPSRRYSDSVADDVTLVEAYAEFDNIYGRVRLGRIPVEFGYEGQLWERELIFPRSLLFKTRTMMLRDVGASYEISQGGFFTGFVIHNGESDQDQDGQIWYTAKWGYRTDKFVLGLSGQTGETKPSSTATSGDTLAGVDPSQRAHWRLGDFFVNFQEKSWEGALEVYAGEREQTHTIGKFMGGHLDLGFQLSRLFSSHVRYDHFDSNMKIDTDLKREISLALVLSNQSKSSNLILVGTKVLESPEVHNDELRLIWSLSPTGIVRF